MSESGSEQSKADKKRFVAMCDQASHTRTSSYCTRADTLLPREYNRNAQRVFSKFPTTPGFRAISNTDPGQRRKEHLKHLEATQKELSGAQIDEIERLRQENFDLAQENESLRRNYGSQASSPGPPNSSPGDLANPPFIPYPPAAPFMAAPPGAPGSAGMGTPNSNLVVVVPNNIAEIRRSIEVLFAPLMDMAVISNPQNHLAALAALAPSLPLQLKPTEMQLRTPHHAYIDMLPSPSLRDRLITIGPANSNTFMTQVCTIVCEIEDTGQMTIWGEDWLNEFSWEFSAEVLERWGGWLLGREWGQRANFWRRQRGAPTLPAWDA